MRHPEPGLSDVALTRDWPNEFETENATPNLHRYRAGLALGGPDRQEQDLLLCRIRARAQPFSRRFLHQQTLARRNQSYSRERRVSLPCNQEGYR